MMFKGAFHLEPLGSSHCPRSAVQGDDIRNNSRVGESGGYVTPTAVQNAYHFAPGHVVDTDISPATQMSYWNAATDCMSNKDCNSFTWQCLSGGCTCPGDNKFCDNKFPKAASLGLSKEGAQGDGLNVQAGQNVFWKTAEQFPPSPPPSVLIAI